MNLYSHCPECGIPVFTSGFPCGYGTLSGCRNIDAVPDDMLQRALLYNSLKASVELANVASQYDKAKTESLEAALTVMVQLYTRTIKDLNEQLEYEKLKTRAYHMLWSAREYLRQLAEKEGAVNGTYYPSDHARIILGNAMRVLEADTVEEGTVNKYKRYFNSPNWRPGAVKYTQNNTTDVPGLLDCQGTVNWKGPRC